MLPLSAEFGHGMQEGPPLGLIDFGLQGFMQQQHTLLVHDELGLLGERCRTGKIPIKIADRQIDAPQAEKGLVAPDRNGNRKDHAFAGIIDGGRGPADPPLRVVLGVYGKKGVIRRPVEIKGNRAMLVDERVLQGGVGDILVIDPADIPQAVVDMF